MRKIVEVLRLKHECGLKHWHIARSVGVARSTVCDYLYRAVAAGLGWPLPESMTEVDVEQLLFSPPPSSGSPPATERHQPSPSGQTEAPKKADYRFRTWATERLPLIPPKVLEAIRCKLRVSHGVLDVLVPKVVL